MLSEKKSLLGIQIDTVSKEEALQKARVFLRGSGQHMIFTPNPEMLVAANTDAYFQDVLNAADINLCDGVGLLLFAGHSVSRIAGVDFMTELLRLAEDMNKKVYFLGSGQTKTIDALKKNVVLQFPNIRIVGEHIGHLISQSETGQLRYDTSENDDIVQDIILAAPDMLFVAFGHGKQEKWIYEQLPDLPSVKIAMGVGGAFDFLAGTQKRAPKLLQSLGLEWLWRLALEPKRIKRILNAVVVFPWYVLKDKLQ
ncbi:MAG: hypothetical protein COU35_00965 [Candidatus Magasanikbacteria bacterium CG10_big_fil_rev_8_21_14_0_10_47_10]|uniref:Glycosyltransferase n=1 Tax=Candidatus Magasanikbacteria bacterium CG10_big_fil_rev_8_21_14_0_10_47_10 TaxID=1974652 RepID=A0A2H0TRE3_9BACT|nr:MAG: hypothetical protein COU35_00965 [Candidatus Magasanikbacteria bacterium CG10_big_fil_rev_8_21_14_0_10_47_10]